jgi:hypothetical protein
MKNAMGVPAADNTTSCFSQNHTWCRTYGAVREDAAASSMTFSGWRVACMALVFRWELRNCKIQATSTCSTSLTQDMSDRLGTWQAAQKPRRAVPRS